MRYYKRALHHMHARTGFLGSGHIYAATEGARNRTLILQQSGYKGPYALQRAPYQEHILNTPIDPMHVIKNIVDRFISLVDERILTKYEMKNNGGRFHSTWLKEGSNVLPPAPFVIQG